LLFSAKPSLALSKAADQPALSSGRRPQTMNACNMT
jgi:hypothetical protein